jgi:hypothetical protein
MKTSVLSYVVMKKLHSIPILLSAVLSGVNVILILLSLTLLSGMIGIAPLAVFHMITIFIVLGIILLNLPLQTTLRMLVQKNLASRTPILGIILLIGAFFLLILAETQLLWISSIPLVIAGLDLLLRGLNRKRKELPILAVASFGYALIYLLLETIPPFWSIYQQFSLFISHVLGVITGTPLSLGPTASDQGILLIFAVFTLSIFLLNHRKTKREIMWFGVSLGGLFLVWIVYLLFLDLLSFATKTDTLNFHPLFFFLCLIPPIGFLLHYQEKEVSEEIIPRKPFFKHLVKNGAVWAAVFLFLSTALLTSVVGMGSESETHHKVLFYGSHMLGTWDFPAYGKYGKDAVGMFGLWPVYLTTLGYETEIVVQNRTQFLQTVQPPDQNITRYLNLTDYTTITEQETITPTLLEGAALLVISNLNISFSKQEQTIIWEFINNGGSLLVIGDHTNVGGLQAPLNELLVPVGIRFRFDAALPLDEKFKWLTCTNLLYHPITIPVVNLDELQYGVGASLDVSASAFPLVIGTKALSDEGNETNEDIAFLGDYEYNKGEQLGDVILVAAAYYGQGKVLVFGDTSMFQNPALPFSYSFVHSTFRWLTGEQTMIITTFQITVSLLFLLAAMVVYYFFKIKTKIFALFPTILCISLLITTSLNPLIVLNPATPVTGNIVSIDVSHNERFALESFTDESVNGLIVNFQRNNYLPILLREHSKEIITRSKLLVMIAPTSSFTADEAAFFTNYMAQGGIVILATGYDDKAAALPLLNKFAIDIEPTPLGPVPYVEGNLTLYQNEPRFVDSWPVSFQDNRTISYYNFTWEDRTFHLVVFTKYGTGGLLVIGDSQYLLDKNIESIYDYWPGNILFLKYLLNELQAMEAKR